MRISDWSSDVCSSDLLFDEIERPAADCRDRGVEPAVPRNHDDRQGGVEGLDRLDESQPVEPRALEPDIDERERRAALADRFERGVAVRRGPRFIRSEEHTSELQSLMRISYAVFCLQKKTRIT